MTTVTRKATVYTLIGRVQPGGVTTSDQGGAQVLDDQGDYQLQDQQGNMIYVSAEDYMTNWQVVTP